MLVIISLLEDEQELSLGMLIRPKLSIISACSMHVLCDFAMFCLNFHTLLNIFGLTYYLSAPSCQFLYSIVFVFRVFRPLKVLQKFRKKYIKNQRLGSLRNHQGRKGGPPQGLQKGPWRDPTLGRAGHPPGCPVAPLSAPFSLYLVPAEETPNIDLLFPFSSLYRHRRRFKIGAARRSCPSTLPEGGSPSGRPSITMDASRMCRE